MIIQKKFLIFTLVFAVSIFSMDINEDNNNDKEEKEIQNKRNCWHVDELTYLHFLWHKYRNLFRNARKKKIIEKFREHYGDERTLKAIENKLYELRHVGKRKTAKLYNDKFWTNEENSYLRELLKTGKSRNKITGLFNERYGERMRSKSSIGHKIFRNMHMREEIDVELEENEENEENEEVKPEHSSKYKGVSYQEKHGRYIGRVSHAGKVHYCGVYGNELDAAIAVNFKCIDLHIRPLHNPNVKMPEEEPARRRIQTCNK